MGENSVRECCSVTVPWVSMALDFRATFDGQLVGGISPVAVHVLFFPLYATYVTVYLVFSLPCYC